MRIRITGAKDNKYVPHFLAVNIPAMKRILITASGLFKSASFSYRVVIRYQVKELSSITYRIL
jgi:hypothetical protein